MLILWVSCIDLFGKEYRQAIPVKKLKLNCKVLEDFVWIPLFALIILICACLGVESDYSGPALEDGKVTLKFMKDLMAAYQEQKKLHKKYAYQVCFFAVIKDSF